MKNKSSWAHYDWRTIAITITLSTALNPGFMSTLAKDPGWGYFEGTHSTITQSIPQSIKTELSDQSCGYLEKDSTITNGTVDVYASRRDLHPKRFTWKNGQVSEVKVLNNDKKWEESKDHTKQHTQPNGTSQNLQPNSASQNPQPNSANQNPQPNSASQNPQPNSASQNPQPNSADPNPQPSFRKKAAVHEVCHAMLAPRAVRDITLTGTHMDPISDERDQEPTTRNLFRVKRDKVRVYVAGLIGADIFAKTEKMKELVDHIHDKAKGIDNPYSPFAPGNDLDLASQEAYEAIKVRSNRSEKNPSLTKEQKDSEADKIVKEAVSYVEALLRRNMPTIIEIAEILAKRESESMSGDEFRKLLQEHGGIIRVGPQD